MEQIWEKAREIGRLIAQSDEYKAFQRANARMSEDRDTVALLNRLRELEESFTRSLQQGVEPPQEQQDEYERVADVVQVSGTYQAFEAARANFDRLMLRIQEEIGKGIEAGEKSRIILPT
ncbi:MAG TPA: YlbF family regulator [Longimicrobiaceae bacterium]|nr:YlbF family regulator [Longimicrobiaceae bacterium]